MTEVFGLDPAFERWRALPTAVPEARWLAWVEAALPELDEDRDDLVAAAPALDDGERSLAPDGRGDDLVERVLLRAMLEECERGRWTGPGGRTAWDLSQCVSLPEDAAPDVVLVWRGLLGLIDPAGEYTCPDPLPGWLAGAYEDAMWRGLASPATVRALVARVDAAPGALEAIVAACVDAGQDAEGEALAGLVTFLRRAAAEGWWVLGTEWST